MSSGWKSFEVCAQKRLYCREQTTEGQTLRARKEESCRESLNFHTEYISNLEQNVGRNMDSKSHSDEVSDENEECVIGQWRKGNICYKVANNLAELCSRTGVLQKEELVSNEIGYLAEATSKQNVGGATWLLLTAYSKIQEERNDLKVNCSLKGALPNPTS